MAQALILCYGSVSYLYTASKCILYSSCVSSGCISLGAAYTYYQKKRAEQIDEAVHKDQLENTVKASTSDSTKSEEEDPKQKKEDPKPKSESESKKNTQKEPTNKPDDSKKTAPEKEINYQQVYNDIAELLDSNEE